MPHSIARHLLFVALVASRAAVAQDGSGGQLSESAPAEQTLDNRTLVEEFTAHTLDAGGLQIGTDLDVGLTSSVMAGTDLISTAVGAPTFRIKVKVHTGDKHRFALGLRGAYLSKKTLLWGSVKNHFDTLEARIIRPSISWTNVISPRLSLHTFWAKGFGNLDVELSEQGKRKLWETKHPGEDFETRDSETNTPVDDEDSTGDDADEDDETDSIADKESDKNQENNRASKSSLHHQSVQVQSITGLAQDRFQMTGEFTRENGNKVLVTTRIEQTAIEELKSNFIRLTAAHQWIWESFQMRLGVGIQYVSVNGEDLDGEIVESTTIQPASDISFYIRL